MPEEGLPCVDTIEAPTVKAVAGKLAKRGLDRDRWRGFLEKLDTERAKSPAVQAAADELVSEADALLRKYPVLIPMADETFSSTEEYGLTAENLGHALNDLRGMAEANAKEDPGCVFEETARWFDEAAAAGQGIVLLRC